MRNRPGCNRYCRQGTTPCTCEMCGMQCSDCQLASTSTPMAFRRKLVALHFWREIHPPHPFIDCIAFITSVAYRFSLHGWRCTAEYHSIYRRNFYKFSIEAFTACFLQISACWVFISVQEWFAFSILIVQLEREVLHLAWNFLCPRLISF